MAILFYDSIDLSAQEIQDVSLENLSRFLAYSKLNPTNRAVNTINLFSDMPKEVIKKLELSDVLVPLKMITDMEAEVDGVHNATFTLNGKRYGFIPSLEDITLGEYADIETFIKQGLSENLNKKEALHGSKS